MGASGNDRADFLDEVCGADPDLRSQVDLPLADTLTTLTTTLADATVVDQPPGDEEVLPYAELLQRLGQSEGALRTAVSRLRARWRKRLCEWVY